MITNLREFRAGEFYEEYARSHPVKVPTAIDARPLPEKDLVALTDIEMGERDDLGKNSCEGRN
jgi:hypothetical protein